MSTVVWMHEDAVNGTLLGRGPAVFVFDEDYLRREGYTLKRVGFLYECLLELPVEIRKGEAVEQILAFAAEHDADEVVMQASPNPWIRGVGAALERVLKVRRMVPEPFVELGGQPDLKRFSRYWARVESRLPIG